MATNRIMIGIPRDLHARLVKLKEEFDHAENWLRMNLPAEFADRGGTPLWYVVEKAVTELEEHRLRSSSAYKKASKQRQKETGTSEGTEERPATG